MACRSIDLSTIITLDIYAIGSAQTWSASLTDDAYEGGYFTNDSIAASAVCLPGATYQWGFSAVLLFVFCCLTIIFAMVLLLLETEVWHYSQAGRTRIDPYKDAVQIAAALKFPIRRFERQTQQTWYARHSII